MSGDVAAYDVQATSAIIALGMQVVGGADEALAKAPVVLSLLPAEPTAHAYASFLAPGALWCNMNLVAPGTKRAADCVIEAAGGRYIDVAVVASVEPARFAVPVLLAGAAAKEAVTALANFGFTNLRVVGSKVGRASALKMIRSVMAKGIEALTAEMMLAAEAAGVTDDVLTSLNASEGPLARVAEMEEVARTLTALGETAGRKDERTSA